MSSTENTPPATDSSRTGDDFLNRAVETTVRIGLLVVLAMWCLDIMRPFIIPTAWGAIIAIAAYPGYRWLLGRTGGSARLAATLVSVALLVTLIVPTTMLSGTLVSGIQGLSTRVHSGSVEIPPPPASVAEWPLIGESVSRTWAQASQNLERALEPFLPQIKSIAGGLVSSMAGLGFALFQFIFSIAIAGIFLANEHASLRFARAISARIAGERGEQFSDLAGATIRSVAAGVLGVAIIQSVLAGVGMVVIGVPGAGLWTLIVLLCAVVQLPTILILGPIAGFMFTVQDTTPAVLFAIWSVLVGLSDNVLKPMLLGRGLDVPMIVIFVGSLGGMMSAGIIGLFVGAVVLTVGYKLFEAWLDQAEPDTEAAGDSS